MERDLGDLGAARAAYRESLELRRQLLSALGDAPQALRDLSVSLNKVGDVERDLGDLEAARAAYRESLERLSPAIARGARRGAAGVARPVRLARRDRCRGARPGGSGGGARRLPREPGAAVGNCARRAATHRRRCATCPSRSKGIGAVERDLGDLEAARAAHRESLDIARRLSGAFPDNPRHQRDLAWIEAQMQAIDEPS